MLKCYALEISILHLQTILSKQYLHEFNVVFNSHNFMIFIVIYSFPGGQVNHHVCMLYKFYIILVDFSLIFIDRLEEENKNSTTGAQNYLIWSVGSLVNALSNLPPLGKLKKNKSSSKPFITCLDLFMTSVN